MCIDAVFFFLPPALRVRVSATNPTAGVEQNGIGGGKQNPVLGFFGGVWRGWDMGCAGRAAEQAALHAYGFCIWGGCKLGVWGGTPPLTNAWTPTDVPHALGVDVAVSVA